MSSIHGLVGDVVFAQEPRKLCAIKTAFLSYVDLSRYYNPVTLTNRLRKWESMLILALDSTQTSLQNYPSISRRFEASEV